MNIGNPIRQYEVRPVAVPLPTQPVPVEPKPLPEREKVGV